jgi:cysteine desulfurase/selenocysteine lyase
MDRFKINATTRMSLAMYNTFEDVDALADSLQNIAARASSKAPAKAVGVEPSELIFPKPAAQSPNAAANELAEAFAFLGDRDSRNQYLLELGEKLLPVPAALKTDASRVHGCMSTVHLIGRKSPAGDRLDFLGDSDAHIVRGLIAVLQKLFAGQKPKEILAYDVQAFFQRIGLDQFISAQRRNGLAGMIDRVRNLAR